MQMAQAYSAIANGGILRSPRVVRRVDGKLLPQPKGRRIISTQTAAQLRTMLEGAFAPGGTASEVSIPGYKLAGKTGTANKIDPATGEYSKFHYIASFMGFAPALHPASADRRHGRRAPGRDLRRRGRRAGLRQDRLLRPAVHAHPAAIGSAGVLLADVIGSDAPAVEVTALAYDNRLVTPGTLFFCVPGFTRDGHDYAGDAIARGAVALVVQRPLGTARARDPRRRRARRDGARRRRAGRRPDRAADHGRDHGHQRQDDVGLPRARRCSRPGVAAPACSAP